jgi:monothiol glutaredoxin
VKRGAAARIQFPSESAIHGHTRARHGLDAEDTTRARGNSARQTDEHKDEESEMSLDEATRQEIDQLVGGNEVMLFMKGTPQAPQCGFSATVVGILGSYVGDFASIDVLSNPHIREGIKAYSSWPTVPQLYVKGEFIGGCDIIQEMNANGELFEALGVDPPPEVVPDIKITQQAATALIEAAAQHGDDDRHLHLAVSGDYQSSLSMGPRGAMDTEVSVSGVTLLIDRMSASRADGARIDVVETGNGMGFKVELPNAPALHAAPNAAPGEPGNMSVHALKAELEAGHELELIDVRTPAERDAACIEASMLLTADVEARLQQLPRDTMLVFICHHGPRGVNAARHFIGLGFENVHNVEGGIDAWSREIDADVPIY